MKRYSVLLGTAALLAASLVGASEIYKWTDAEGNVHYEDRPVGQDVERVNIVSNRTDRAAVQARLDARAEARAARAEAEAEGAQDATKKDPAEERAEKAEQCQKYRARLDNYLRSQRLYREGADGEREYLDDAQIMAARANVEDKIKEFCN